MKVFEEYVKAKEYKMPFEKKDFLNSLFLIVEMVEY